MDKRGDDACILLMNVLKEVEKYRDKRLVENFVVTSVMEYVRIYGMENTEGMDRIFRKRVHRVDYVAEYQRCMMQIRSCLRDSCRTVYF